MHFAGERGLQNNFFSWKESIKREDRENLTMY